MRRVCVKSDMSNKNSLAIIQQDDGDMKMTY